MRMLSREWRSGELGVLLLALTIAVAALTGVGFLVSRISAAVAMQASQVLAADIRLESSQPIAEAYMAAARQDGLQVAGTTGLLSVVFQGDASQLTDINAVTVGYPLRGTVMVANQPFAKGLPVKSDSAAGRSVARLETACGARRSRRWPAHRRRRGPSRRTRPHLQAR